MIKKLYLGIDPDLRLINAALVSDQGQTLAVFARKNKGNLNDKAVSVAALVAHNLYTDVVSCINGLNSIDVIHPECKLVVIVESQNMEHARAQRKKGNRVNYQSLLQLGQVAGIMLGTFANISNHLVLVQAQEWKGSVPKHIAQPRYYKALGLTPDPEKRVSNIYPLNKDDLCYYSGENINLGDFKDINDSLGLAAYGVKKGL